MDEDEKRYLDHRQLLIQGRFLVSASLDKAILTLSGGALAVSMTFIKDIAQDPKCTWVLVGAWISFGFTIGVMLLSFYVCQLAYKREREILDAKQHRKSDEGKNNNITKRNNNAKNIWIILTETGTLISTLSFMIGLVFLGIFIWINM
jgi:hypothetical protein